MEEETGDILSLALSVDNISTPMMLERRVPVSSVSFPSSVNVSAYGLFSNMGTPSFSPSTSSSSSPSLAHVMYTPGLKTTAGNAFQGDYLTTDSWPQNSRADQMSMNGSVAVSNGNIATPLPTEHELTALLQSTDTEYFQSSASSDQFPAVGVFETDFTSFHPPLQPLPPTLPPPPPYRPPTTTSTTNMQVDKVQVLLGLNGSGVPPPLPSPPTNLPLPPPPPPPPPLSHPHPSTILPRAGYMSAMQSASSMLGHRRGMITSSSGHHETMERNMELPISLPCPVNSEAFEDTRFPQQRTAQDREIQHQLLIGISRTLSKMSERLERDHVTVISRLESLEKKVEHLYEFTEGLAEQMITADEAKSCDNEAYYFNGKNLLMIPSRDPYSYGLTLMDVLFTKEELNGSLLFKSTKSEKPELDQQRVAKLIDCITKNHGKNWDIKKFTLKANQKCRDTKISLPAVT